MDYRIFDAKDATLENGLRVVTIKKNTRITSIHFGVKVGSLYENKSEKGISHFIEHMLFKGTGKRNNEELNNDLEHLGGEYNAYTDYSCTVYSITALEEELEKGLELMSDMLINSTFPESEIKKERGVILAEIRTSKDDVEDYSFRMVNKAAFSKSPLKYDVIGEEATVKKFNQEMIKQFYNKYYCGNNSIITVVSSLDHDKVLNIIRKYFLSMKRQELDRKEIVFESNKPLKQLSYKKDIEQSTIVYLYTFHNLKKENEMALRILNHKLGESTNSILFRELREERGLAYDIYTHMDMSSAVKTLYIYTSVSEDKVDESISVIDECIEKIKKEIILFNDETVVLMKKILKTAVASTMEDSTDIGNYILHQCLEDENIYQFIEDMKEMDRIKKEEIYETARLVLKNPTIHILKPHNS
jgi:predicted Zn-dependent peptidase